MYYLRGYNCNTRITGDWNCVEASIRKLAGPDTLSYLDLVRHLKFLRINGITFINSLLYSSQQIYDSRTIKARSIVKAEDVQSSFSYHSAIVMQLNC